jgi:predicted nucleotidyltransferase
MIAIDVPKEQLRDFCKKWKVTELALFGSVTRPEEFRPDSDVDVLVRFAEDARVGLFELSHMEDELKAIFGRDIDLADKVGLDESRNRTRANRILSTAVPLEL